MSYNIGYNTLETPCYIINKQEYEKNIEEIIYAFDIRWNKNVVFGYSVKTNHFPYLMNVAKQYGFYSEVVSEDELFHSFRLGFSPEHIILNGPNKTSAILKQINEKCIINLDNFDELETIIMNKDILKAKVGLRVSIGLEKYVPGETTTKNNPERFGFSCDNGELNRAVSLLRSNGIPISGIHLHHSSSSRSLRVFEAICSKAIEIVTENNLIDIKYIDIGGGYFGGNYFKNKPSIEEYAETITSILKKRFDSSSVTLIIEPGAAILATACDYLTSVVNVRNHDGYRIVTVDGTCLHINPFMKDRQVNPCTIINPGNKLGNTKQIIGGSTCMEMDRLYPRDIDCFLNEDSKLLFHCAGAYTMTHNSNFINAIPNVYVLDENGYKIVREKTYLTMG